PASRRVALKYHHLRPASVVQPKSATLKAADVGPHVTIPQHTSAIILHQSVWCDLPHDKIRHSGRGKTLTRDHTPRGRSIRTALEDRIVNRRRYEKSSMCSDTTSRIQPRPVIRE